MQALAFDFDGLILDTETPEFTVWKAVFQEHGVEMPADYWTQVIGRGAEQEIERPHQLLTRLTGDYVETAEKHEDRRRRILELIDREVVRPGILDLIQQAKSERLPIGIASSSKHAWVDRYLERLGLTESFQTIVCADDVNRAKPFPDLYLELARKLGAEPEFTVALEDSPNGIAAAKAAGMFAVVVPNPVTTLLDVSQADLRIDDLAEWDLDRLRVALKSNRN